MVLFNIMSSITKGSQEGIDSILRGIIPMAIGLIVPIFVYEELQKPEDNNWRKLAEILGSLQVFFFGIILLILIASFIFIIIGGLSGESQFVSTKAYPFIENKHLEYKIYTNPNLGFLIKYPDYWTISPVIKNPDYQFAQSMFITNPNGKTALGIGVYDFSNTVYSIPTVDVWADSMLASVKSDAIKNVIQGQTWQTTKNAKTQLSGYYAREIDYTYTTNTGNENKGAMILTIKGSKGYYLGFEASKENYDSDFPMATVMFDSFTIT